MPHFSEQERTKKLEKIKEKEKPISTGVKINFRGEVKPFDVYRIPLKYLIYNKYNGRIGTSVKSYEAQHGGLNPEEEDDVKVIEKFLWNSKKDRNQTTLKSLVENGQLQNGIVTVDGKIVDGNRRAMLLNTIKKDPATYPITSNNDKYYFNAVILDSKGTEKELLHLETYYQMGQDEKLGYNPIEKYLKCHSLKKSGFTEIDISKLMNEKLGKVKEWLETYEVMDQYLEHYGYTDIFTMLEKREDLFLTLNKDMRSWKAGQGYADWGPKKLDIGRLRTISFDYIRAQTEGKSFRVIGKKSGNGVFANEKIWKKFSDGHKEKIDSISDLEITPDKAKIEQPGTDFAEIFRARDEEWKEKTYEAREGLIGKAVHDIEDKINADEPFKLLDRALSALQNIKSESKSFTGDPRLFDIVREINSLSHRLKKELGG
jgi:hypothetical protein